jgi:hypothetical protein
MTRHPETIKGCFITGTLPHTKEGPKPIEDIRVGDYVLSAPKNGEGEKPASAWSIPRSTTTRESG